MKKISRRKFLEVTSICASSIVISTALTGCQLLEKQLSKSSEFSFEHGVASGDPLVDAVILWTRVTPKSNSDSLRIGWEISTTENFSDIVRNGLTTVSNTTDFTVKIDVKGLQAGNRYYYRFLGKGFSGETGTTKTLPVKHLEHVKFIVCSCANYPAGFFNAYEEAAKIKDIDAVLHLGDYLYEYGMGEYATEHAEEIGRALPVGSDKEMISLEDYRNRYNLYRKDLSLQKLHAKAPFIMVWDDHEIANDTWKNGAQNHNSGEGDFITRKLAAIRAWYEWLPVRVVAEDNKQQIYRSFNFGNLLSLHMLDTRVIARDKQLNKKDYKNNQGEFDKKSFQRDLNHNNRSLLGEKQFSWLEQQMINSTAQWQLLGQQVLMGKMLFPDEAIKDRKSLAQVPAILNQLAALKQSLESHPGTPLQQQRLSKKSSYNMDAWDGYPHEREKIYAVAKKQHKNLLVVAGDTHNAWANNLVDDSGDNIGVEFAVQSISSPGMEKYLKMSAPQAFQTAQSLTSLVDHMLYCNLHQRGFLELDISVSEVTAKWTFIDTLLSKEYQQAGSYTIRHQLDS